MIYVPHCTILINIQQKKKALIKKMGCTKWFNIIDCDLRAHGGLESSLQKGARFTLGLIIGT